MTTAITIAKMALKTTTVYFAEFTTGFRCKKRFCRREAVAERHWTNAGRSVGPKVWRNYWGADNARGIIPTRVAGRKAQVSPHFGGDRKESNDPGVDAEKNRGGTADEGFVAKSRRVVPRRGVTSQASSMQRIGEKRWLSASSSRSRAFATCWVAS